MADKPKNSSKDINVNLSLGEEGIIREFRDSVKLFTEAVTALGGATKEVKNVVKEHATVTQAEGPRTTRARRATRDTRLAAVSREEASGRNFVPFNSFRDLMHGSELGSEHILERGIDFPRYGNWTMQDRLIHGAIVAGHYGRHHVIDTSTGAISPGISYGTNDEKGRTGIGDFMHHYQNAPKSEKFFWDEENQMIVSNKDPRTKSLFTKKGTPRAGTNLTSLADMTNAQIRDKALSTAVKRGGLATLSDLALGSAKIGGIAGTAVAATRALMGQIGEHGQASMQLGLGKTSAAGLEEGFGSKFQSMLASGFGFNPFFSSSQADATMNAIHGLGYRGNQRSQLFNMTSDMVSQHGLDAKTTVEQIDRAFRSGSSSINDFRSILLKIPAAANAATMSVQQMQKSLGSIAENVSQTQGIGYASAFNQATALTSAGIQPDVANKMMTNTWFEVLGANKAGQTLGQYLTSGNEAIGNLQALGTAFRISFNRDIKDLIKDPQLEEKVAQVLKATGGLWLGQYSIDDLNKLSAQLSDAGTVKNIGAEGQLQRLSPINVGSKSFVPGIGEISTRQGRIDYNQQLTSIVESSGLSSKDKSDLSKKLASHGGLGEKDGSNFVSLTDEYQMVNKAISEYARSAAAKAQTTAAVSISFKGNAGNILQAVLDGESGNAKYDQNSQTYQGGADAQRPAAWPVYR